MIVKQMNKTLFKDWLNNKRDFIETLNIPENIIGEGNLKTLLMVKYGQKEVHRIFDDMTGLEVANYLNSLYNSKWEWLESYLLNDFELGETNRKTITEDYNNDLTGNVKGTSTNKESAYNTEEFVNSDLTENTSENKNNQKGTRTREESYKSYYTSLQQLKNVNSDSMLELVLKDIQNELCLQVY